MFAGVFLIFPDSPRMSIVLVCRVVSIENLSPVRMCYIDGLAMLKAMVSSIMEVERFMARLLCGCDCKLLV